VAGWVNEAREVRRKPGRSDGENGVGRNGKSRRDWENENENENENQDGKESHRQADRQTDRQAGGCGCR